MKIYLLNTGDYEQRSVHSVHTSRREAEDVSARLQRAYSPEMKSSPDIDEVELDEDLCAVCGYDEGLHKAHPGTWKHPFMSSRLAQPQSGS